MSKQSQNLFYFWQQLKAATHTSAIIAKPYSLNRKCTLKQMLFENNKYN